MLFSVTVVDVIIVVGSVVTEPVVVSVSASVVVSKVGGVDVSEG